MNTEFPDATKPRRRVHVSVEVTGEIVGRTYEENPRFDIRLPDGRVLNGIPAEFVRDSNVVSIARLKS